MSDTPHTDDAPAVDQARPADELNWYQRLRQKRWARWGIDLLFFAVAFAAITMWQGRELVESGTPAPQFQLRDMHGATHSLKDYRGKTTFVVFWAPWCPVCGAEVGNVNRAKTWLGDHVNVISVVLDYQGHQDIQKFIDKHGVDYPVLLGNKSMMQDYHLKAFPTMYVLDADGNVEHTVVGYTTTAGMLWRGWL